MLYYQEREELYWDSRNAEVRFSVANETRSLLCRIEGGALEREGARTGDPDSYVAVAKRCFEHITRRISDKLALGLTEADGSVIVRTRDW